MQRARVPAVWEYLGLNESSRYFQVFFKYAFENATDVCCRPQVSALVKVGRGQARPVRLNTTAVDGTAEKDSHRRRAMIRTARTVNVGRTSKLGHNRDYGFRPRRTQAIA